MRVRITLMTENDKPISVLGENPEKELKSKRQIRKCREIFGIFL